jgi:hypothetical protein
VSAELIRNERRIEGRPPGKCHYHVVYHSAMSLGIGRRLHVPLSLVPLACARGLEHFYTFVDPQTDAQTEKTNLPVLIPVAGIYATICIMKSACACALHVCGRACMFFVKPGMESLDANAQVSKHTSA